MSEFLFGWLCGTGLTWLGMMIFIIVLKIRGEIK